ncbi:hypothetical protein [Arthrobacter sp. B10-11]|nr:hypothetical protein [Arthrobacter sp. B10-11]MDV8146258.1 hypothetical protein [Arthrobacter sp. B10-11]
MSEVSVEALAAKVQALEERVKKLEEETTKEALSVAVSKRHTNLGV